MNSSRSIFAIGFTSISVPRNAYIQWSFKREYISGKCQMLLNVFDGLFMIETCIKDDVPPVAELCLNFGQDSVVRLNKIRECSPHD